MTIIITVGDYAVGFRVGLSFGRVKKDAPAPEPKQEDPAPRKKSPVGFTRNADPEAQ